MFIPVWVLVALGFGAVSLGGLIGMFTLCLMMANDERLSG